MGLDIYLEWDGMTEEEEKARYTGFANKGDVGYLRSSYNEGGFNSWADMHIEGKGFYYIFQPIDSDVEQGFKPNWDECEVRRKEALALALKAKNNPRVIRCSHFFNVKREDIIKKFNETVANHGDCTSLNWFSNSTGDFFLGDNQPKLLAVFNGEDCTYILCKSEDNHEYYISLLENEVSSFIALGRQKDARVIWSG